MHFEFEEDSFQLPGSLTHEHKKLTAARKIRRQTEEDAQLLANRIILLKQEEARAQRKIEDTRKKAQETIQNRLRAAVQQKNRDTNKQLKQQQLLERTQLNRQVKNQHEKAKETQKLAINTRIRRDSSAIRQSKKENQNTIHQKRTEDLHHNTSVSQRVKHQKTLAVQKRLMAEAEKRARARVLLEQKLERENRIRDDKEREISGLEQEELELIQRLQNSQLMQRSAYDTLDQALYGDVEDSFIFKQY